MVDFSGVLSRLPTRADVLAAADRVPRGRDAASPFVAGDTVGRAAAVVADVVASGMSASVQYLAVEGIVGPARLAAFQTIEALANEDLGHGNDLAVDPVALGLGSTPTASVRTNLAAICAAADEAGLTVTLLGALHDDVAGVLELHASLRDEFPDLGVTVAANLLRSESDCLDLAGAGSRVRLVRRSGPEPASFALTRGHEVDLAYVRCLRILMGGGARTTIATHDPTLVDIADALATRAERETGHQSYQFRLGVLTEQAEELAAAGASVSILVPFGPAWAEYVSSHIALRPASVGAALRAAVAGGADR